MPESTTDTIVWRVVIIDDEPDLVVLLGHALTRSGRFEVVGSAGSGESGLETVGQLRPDAVLLDLRLPRLSGRDILPDLRALVPDAVIVMLTADSSDPTPYLAAGADAFVDKAEAMSGITDKVLSLMQARDPDVAAARPAARPTERPDARPDATGPPPAVRDPDEAIDRLLATLVHDLRSPLTVIQGFASTLVTSADRLDATAVRAGAEAIERQAGVMSDALSRLADVQMLRGNSLVLVAEPVALGDVLTAIAERGVSVTGGAGLVVDGDARRITRILDEVITNAEHFGSGLAVDVDARLEGSDAVVRVRDRGPGLPTGNAPYAAFERLESTHTGTGVGLYLARGLAELHGGSVTHGPADGGGTVVTVRLPVA